MQSKYNTKAMKCLPAWLAANKIRKSELAKTLGICWTTLWTWVSGNRRPTLEAAVRIEELTNGQIPCSYWVKLESNKKERNSTDSSKNKQQKQHAKTNHKPRPRGKHLTK